MLTIVLLARYVIRLMEWIDDMITDEKIFPPVDDIPFPRCTHIIITVIITNPLLTGTFRKLDVSDGNQ